MGFLSLTGIRHATERHYNLRGLSVFVTVDWVFATGWVFVSLLRTTCQPSGSR